MVLVVGFVCLFVVVVFDCLFCGCCWFLPYIMSVNCSRSLNSAYCLPFPTGPVSSICAAFPTSPSPALSQHTPPPGSTWSHGGCTNSRRHSNFSSSVADHLRLAGIHRGSAGPRQSGHVWFQKLHPIDAGKRRRGRQWFIRIDWSVVVSRWSLGSGSDEWIVWPAGWAVLGASWATGGCGHMWVWSKQLTYGRQSGICFHSTEQVRSRQGRKRSEYIVDLGWEEGKNHRQSEVWKTYFN